MSEDIKRLVSENIKRLIRDTLEAGIHRVHDFSDGRRVYVKSKAGCGREVYLIEVTHKARGWRWADGCGYHEKSECVKVAQELFSIAEWNRFNGEEWKP